MLPNIDGFNKLYYENQSFNNIEFFINNTVIKNLFWHILIFTIALTGFLSIIAVIRIMIKNNKSIFKVVAKFMIVIISVLIVVVFLLISLIISTKIISLLTNTFPIDYNFNLPKMIFNNSVGEWYNDYSINEIDFNECQVTDLLGSYHVEGQLLPTKWNHDGIINPDKFQFLPCLITLIICLGSLLLVSIRMIKRIYEIVLLYCLMPISLSSLPLDDGISFKNWLDYFINKFLILYGSVLAINLFFFMFPIIIEFSLVTNSKYEGVYKLLIIMGSVVSIPIGQTIFNKIFKIKNYKDKSITKEEKIIYQTNTDIIETTNHRYVEDNYLKRRYENCE